jgi:hypothetical protein
VNAPSKRAKEGMVGSVAVRRCLFFVFCAGKVTGGESRLACVRTSRLPPRDSIAGATSQFEINKFNAVGYPMSPASLASPKERIGSKMTSNLGSASLIMAAFKSLSEINQSMFRLWSCCSSKLPRNKVREEQEFD